MSVITPLLTFSLFVCFSGVVKEPRERVRSPARGRGSPEKLRFECKIGWEKEEGKNRETF
jgi:hypothetical protein